MAKETGFRIYGAKLGRTDGYVDVDVVGADTDGTVYIQDAASGSSEEWSLSPEDLTELKDGDLLVSSGSIPVPNHAMWDTLQAIGTNRENTNINNFVDDRLKNSGESMFRALVEAGK